METPNSESYETIFFKNHLQQTWAPILIILFRVTSPVSSEKPPTSIAELRTLETERWVVVCQRWHRDIHLLTVGRYTYTSDQRFEAIHSPHTEDWTLRIRYPQRKDSGIYECQISTTPPIGHPVHLTVVEPITEIVGGPDLFINTGSTINLTCLVRYAPEPPPVIVWSHDRKVITFDSPRGGISLVTEKGLTTTSRLLIQKAIHPDTGIYTCDPSNANRASVRVHVLNGEHPAAMQRGSAISLSSPTLISALVAPMRVLLYVCNNFNSNIST
ncbi:hypothetical protein RUM43_000008 [Polyplax serrata]|uniref:Ig-like domain-containing protein n=1 Tax=Polyplax serrata TaxID=468196 RepID=A0AAN8SFR5_POLSC